MTALGAVLFCSIQTYPFLFIRQKRLGHYWVKTIFSYNPNKKWSKKEIEEELIQYEVIRREYIFKEIHNFEAYILKHGVVGDEPKFRRYVIDLLEKAPDPVLQSGQKLLSSFDFEANDISKLSLQRPLIQKVLFVILIRNKFAHNELIHLNYWKQLHLLFGQYDSERFKSIADYLLHSLRSFIQDIESYFDDKLYPIIS